MHVCVHACVCASTILVALALCLCFHGIPYALLNPPPQYISHSFQCVLARRVRLYTAIQALPHVCIIYSQALHCNPGFTTRVLYLQSGFTLQSRLYHTCALFTVRLYTAIQALPHVCFTYSQSLPTRPGENISKYNDTGASRPTAAWERGGGGKNWQAPCSCKSYVHTRTCTCPQRERELVSVCVCVCV